MPKNPKLESSDVALKNLEHHQYHINELKGQFDDLMVEVQIDGSILFMSKKIIPLVDGVEFYKNTDMYYTCNVHYAKPYKDVSTNCSICNDEKSISKIKVLTLPIQIPLAVENTATDNTFIYTMSFEDSMEQLGFDKHIIGKSRIYLTDHLKSSQIKYKEIFINSSVKNIMVFS